MLNFAPFLMLIWLFGFVMRLIAQMDEAGIAVTEGRLDRKPYMRELLPDAALWWLWMLFDFSRWMKGKLYGGQ